MHIWHGSGLSKRKSRAIVACILIAVFCAVAVAHSVYESWRVEQRILERTDKVLSKRSTIKNPLSSYPFFYELKPGGVQKNLDGLTVPINSDGIVGEREYSRAKDPDSVRIMLMGGSVPFGLGVSVQDTFAMQLEELLNANRAACGGKRFEVINMSVPGYDIVYATELYRLHGYKYVPDIVLMNVVRSNLTFVTEDHRRFTAIDGASVKELNPADRERALDDFFKHIEFGPSAYEVEGGALQKLARLYRGPMVIFDVRQPDAMDVAYLTHMFRDNAAIHVLAQPQQDEYTLSATADILPNFHLSRSGHQKIAHTLFNYMKEEKIIECAQ